MEELKKKVEKLSDIKERLVQELQTEVSKGIRCPECHANELGALVDMVKDLAEAEEKCMKACYYKTVIKAMKDQESEPRWSEPMGYNTRRYASGRYAPAGQGHISGFHDDEMMMDMNDEWFMRNKNYNRDNSNGSYGYSPDEKYGRAWKQYEMARRHYTETGSMNDKKEMDEHAMEHVDSFIDTAKNIYKHADQPMKRQIKADLKAMVAEMPD